MQNSNMGTGARRFLFPPDIEFQLLNGPLSRGRPPFGFHSHPELVTFSTMLTNFEEAQWIRLPKPKAKCPVTGLSRTSLSEVCRRVGTDRKPLIKTVRLKQKPTSTRDILLINKASLLKYLDKEAARQASEIMSDSSFMKSSLSVTEAQIANSKDLWERLVIPYGHRKNGPLGFRKDGSPMRRRMVMKAIGLTVDSSPRSAKIRELLTVIAYDKTRIPIKRVFDTEINGLFNAGVVSRRRRLGLTPASCRSRT
jgi:hypothetical protein